MPGPLDAFWGALVHVVRNAVNHGIEWSDERLGVGKAARGKVTLRTLLIDGQFVVELQDDGRGVDFQALAEVTSLQGLPIERTRTGSVHVPRWCHDTHRGHRALRTWHRAGGNRGASRGTCGRRDVGGRRDHVLLPLRGKPRQRETRRAAREYELTTQLVSPFRPTYQQPGRFCCARLSAATVLPAGSGA